MMQVVNPVSHSRKTDREIEYVDSLEDKVVGFFDNGWSSWDQALEIFEKQLKDKFGVKEVKTWSVPLASEASAEIIREAANQCDAVIVGLGN